MSRQDLNLERVVAGNEGGGGRFQILLKNKLKSEIFNEYVPQFKQVSNFYCLINIYHTIQSFL